MRNPQGQPWNATTTPKGFGRSQMRTTEQRTIDALTYETDGANPRSTAYLPLNE
ncbi:MAG: hypothetical protein ACJ0H0_01600 [Vicinamibacterales bacterium]